ncbi:MAG: FHA domain-containing protein [Planctomycetota bacterium]|nr:FHA domain-containing protein [Planctomycetota bacterium]
MLLGEFAEHIQGIPRGDFVERYPGPFLLFGGLDLSPKQQPLISFAGAYDAKAKDKVLLGSGQHCAISIEDPHIAAEHALFREKATSPNKGWYVYDMNSDAGSRLNGLRLMGRQPYMVSPGDTLQFGKGMKATFFETEQIHDMLCAFETRLEFKAFDPGTLGDTPSGIGLLQNSSSSPTVSPPKFDTSPPSQKELRHWVHCPPMRPLPIKDGEPFLIGRDFDSHLCLPHPKISRHHATIKIIDGSIWIEDMESTNGTLVSDFQIPPKAKSPVSPSQFIKIGPFEIQVNSDSNFLKDKISDMGHKTTQAMMAGGDLSEEICLSGLLVEMSVRELLGRCLDQKKTGTVVIEDMFTEGTVIFSSGRPVHAESSDLKGEAALKSMVEIEDGHFSFKNSIRFPKKPNLNISPIEFRIRYVEGSR